METDRDLAVGSNGSVAEDNAPRAVVNGASVVDSTPVFLISSSADAPNMNDVSSTPMQIQGSRLETSPLPSKVTANDNVRHTEVPAGALTGQSQGAVPDDNSTASPYLSESKQSTVSSAPAVVVLGHAPCTLPTTHDMSAEEHQLHKTLPITEYAADRQAKKSYEPVADQTIGPHAGHATSGNPEVSIRAGAGPTRGSVIQSAGDATQSTPIHPTGLIKHFPCDITGPASDITHSASDITGLISDITRSASGITHSAYGSAVLPSDITRSLPDTTRPAVSHQVTDGTQGEVMTVAQLSSFNYLLIISEHSC